MGREGRGGRGNLPVGRRDLSRVVAWQKCRPDKGFAEVKGFRNGSLDLVSERPSFFSMKGWGFMLTFMFML